MFDGDGFQYRYMELKNLLKLINMYPYTLRIKIDTKKKKKNYEHWLRSERVIVNL